MLHLPTEDLKSSVQPKAGRAEKHNTLHWPAHANVSFGSTCLDGSIQGKIEIVRINLHCWRDHSTHCCQRPAKRAFVAIASELMRIASESRACSVACLASVALFDPMFSKRDHVGKIVLRPDMDLKRPTPVHDVRRAW